MRVRVGLGRASPGRWLTVTRRVMKNPRDMECGL